MRNLYFSEGAIRTLKELRAEVNTSRRRLIIRVIKVIVATFIGLEWDINYSTYVASQWYEDDVRSFLLRYLSDSLSGFFAEIISWITPWLGFLCLFYPLHCYLRAIGWYCHSSSTNEKATLK